ncbi:MAG: Type 1 glutamine amidotransferase-like domain-containing protein [Clostridia bacterium]|nr:Type 1 glutamine amidotransferase-like domain-containing protein [Clostridia bacterium]
MNRIFQCSLVVTSIDKDNKKIACPIENKNILRELKDVKSISHLLFVCSNPTVFDKTDLYAPLTKEAFNLSGIPVKAMTILDSRTDKDMVDLVKKSDVIFLAGGVTPMQMEYFNKINLKAELHKYNDKIIIGQSAGAMNLANVVYNSPEIYEMQDTSTTYYEGLGFSDVNIEPHFDINEKEYIVKVLLPDSSVRPFIALDNNGFVVRDDLGTRLYGDAYAFYNGVVKKINDNDTMRKLPENFDTFYKSLDE